jgi:hypothetical protein
VVSLATQRPPWITEEKQQKLRVLYQDDPAALRREICGLIESDHARVFEGEHLDAWHDKSRIYTFPYVHVEPLIFISIDPGAGTHRSDTAFASFAYSPEGELVVSP